MVNNNQLEKWKPWKIETDGDFLGVYDGGGSKVAGINFPTTMEWGLWERIVASVNHFDRCGFPAKTFVDEHEKDKLKIAALTGALETWKKFWDTMPKGQMGKLSFDVGLFNDGFVKMGRALALVKGK